MCRDLLFEIIKSTECPSTLSACMFTVFESLICLVAKYSDLKDLYVFVSFRTTITFSKSMTSRWAVHFTSNQKWVTATAKNILILRLICLFVFYVCLMNPLWKCIYDITSLSCFVAQVVRAKERLEEELYIQSENQEKQKTPETWSTKWLLPHRSPSQASVNYVLIKVFSLFLKKILTLSHFFF